MIFNIQRFSTHDGAGIRTVIFFKGCSLRCPWCENPESQSFRQELAWDERKCIGCLDCARIAANGEMEVENGRPVFHRQSIHDAGKFENVCPTGALTVIGEQKSITGIIEEVQKDLPFYRKSGGGVTLSGGEPCDQPVFLLELLRALEQIGLRPAVETALSVPWAAIEPSIPFVEAFLADLKHADPAKLKAETGGNLPLVIANLRKLERSGSPVTVRVPVIPGFNDSLPEMAAIIELAASLGNIRMIHFLPFHTLGVGKYRLLEREYRFLRQADTAEDLGRYLDLARSKGLEASTGG